jgi:hypothetical protein
LAKRTYRRNQVGKKNKENAFIKTAKIAVQRRKRSGLGGTRYNSGNLNEIGSGTLLVTIICKCPSLNNLQI